MVTSKYVYGGVVFRLENLHSEVGGWGRHTAYMYIHGMHMCMHYRIHTHTRHTIHIHIHAMCV
ncbi:hypothetical protein EON63_12745 [archaeon]|nr:MAG: hypothetical protein EON63_12745 [archaeon]